MKEKKFICIEDFQLGLGKDIETLKGFAVGLFGDVDFWKKIALNWADSDGNFEIYKMLKKEYKKNIIDFISNYWQIEIVEITEKEINFLDKLNEQLNILNEDLTKIENKEQEKILNEKIRTIKNIIIVFYDNLK